MDLQETQLELERDMVDMGVLRYKEAVDKDVAKGREFDTAAAQSVMYRSWNKVMHVARAAQVACDARLDEGMTTGRRLGGWEHSVSAMDTEKLAYITLKVIVTKATTGTIRVQSLAFDLGQAIYLELHWDAIRKAEASAAKARGTPNRISSMRKRVLEVNPKSVRKWLKKLNDLDVPQELRSTQVSRTLKIQAGAELLGRFLEACPEVAELRDHQYAVGGTPRHDKVVGLTEDFIKAVAEAHAFRALKHPWLLPMVIPPVPWESDGTYIKAGGYLKNRIAFVKRPYYNQHTSQSSVSPAVIAAVNLVQETAWRINPTVLQVAQHCIENDEGPVPYEAPVSMPENVPDEEWETMTREERGIVKSQREKVHSHNNKARAKQLSADRVLSAALDMVEYERLYFPHAIDWRGRMYPLPQDLHPQADDFAKAMLTFADTKPLGSRGYSWLMYHAANCYGIDKVDRVSQETWCLMHAIEIQPLAQDPMGHMEFWMQADEPWQFLAACIELTNAWHTCENPEDYECSLPVSVDGSCNGLQHLSAMGLDPVGAEAVNLMSGPRQDIYQIVADKVNQKVMLHRGQTVASPSGEYPGEYQEVASQWYGKVSRKTVKRGVMTTPYGLTSMGMRDQLLKDGFCDDLEGDRMQNANYLRDRMKEAIGGTLVKGTEIMKWMQTWAKRLADEGKPIEWSTPVGLRVKQGYYHLNMSRKTTLLGKLNIADGSTDVMKMSKQVQSIAPNIIHSFDAAHLMLTVEDMGANYSYAMVHDSFGTHACDVDALLESTKRTFVQIYEQDWFADLDFDFHAQLGEVTEVEPPERGTFDIQEVLDSDYFFA